MPDQVEVERGRRTREIREERGEDQAQFAAHLNLAAEQLKLSVRYDATQVSRRETARKALDPEDFATIAMLDPQRRGWTWVAFGRAITVGKDAWTLLAGDQGKRRTG